MMDKNELSELSHELPRWKKITASVMLPVLTMTFTAPTLANIRINQTIEQLEDHLASSSRYLLDAQVDNYIEQYNQNLAQLDIRDGLTDLLTTIFNDYPQFKPEIDWAPISGDVTFFVPLPTPKAYGNGALQREIIRFQLKQLIGSSRISELGFGSYEQMQTEYYQNAISFMQETGHRFGDNLSQQDIDNLQYDIIWPEKRHLPGVGRVFIPFVYLTSRTIDAQSRCVKSGIPTPRLSEYDKASLQHAIAKGMSDLVHESRESSSHYHERFSSPLTQLTDGLAQFYKQSSEDATIRFENYDCQTGEPETPDYIGSAYIQRDLVRQQLNVLLNRSYLVAPKAYDTYEEMAQELYQNGFQYLRSNGLIFGQKLTQAQMNSLTEDMLWPEFEILANGSKVLVPRIYLTAQTVKANKVDGTTFSLGEGTITATDFLNKGGKVLAMRDTLIRTRNSFINDKGHLSAKEGIQIEVGGLLSNLSGTIEGRDVKLTAYALKNQTLVYRYDHAYGFNEQAQQLAKIESFGDLNIQTASHFVSIGGQFSSQGDLKVNAGGTVQLLPAEVRHSDAQSGHGWSQSSQSLTNIQTKMSAIDLLSIATKQTLKSKGSILESEGTIELLAGQGIYLLAAQDQASYHKLFEAGGSGVFGSSEKREESEQRSRVIATLLRAGHDLILKTEAAPVQLKATRLTSHGLTKIVADTIDIGVELEKYFYSKSESFEGSLSFGNKGYGVSKETAHMTEFRAQGGLILDARNGITVELPRNPYQTHLDHNALIDQLAQNDGLSWLKDVKDANPEANWREIDLVLEQWDYDQSGLTPAAMTILAVAVAVATGGTGVAGLAGVSASAGATSAAMAAGINALAMQATASLLANGGDISDTFDQLTSKDSIRGLATSMITAGVMQGLDLNFVSEGLNGVGVNEVVADIAQQSANSILSSVVAVQVNSLLSGDGLSGIDDFDNMVVNALVTSSISTVGPKLANKISEAKTGENPISTASGYIAHAALGCALGAARQIAAGGNSNENVSGCGSGAAGAVIGEFAAELYKSNTDFEEKLALLESESRNFSSKFLNDMNDPEINPQSLAYRQQLIQDLLKIQKMGGDIGRLVAGITLFATGANHSNIDHAMFAGGNSAENNAFFIPALIFAFNTLMVALLAQSIKETVEEVWDIIENPENLTDEVIEAKVKELLVDKLIEMGIDHILRLKLVKKGKEAILEAIEDWSADDVLDKMIDHAKTDGQMSPHLDQLEQLREKVSDPSKPKPMFPDGMAFKPNIKTHISTVDGFSQKRGVSGGHNMDAFNQIVADKDLKIVTSTDHATITGITHIQYQIPSFDREGNVTGYKKELFEKTIYDPRVFSNNKIMELGQAAAAKGYSDALSQGLAQFTAEAGGMKFRVYVRDGIINNFHPEM
ncbi:DUF637 domain-containing protein [Vibrio sp. Isolate23]|uniref:DUF637 domain-containing protein n=1 Tax=Vibrio sp. Isolate23 TaxID=2908533 RepID=UPI001EFD8859|nr:DUF637 domain-containing protein [Vibrio sp. Isolate23]MCG9683645.1 DUF637 domain-containing protein [Vibrio sp. Isolate23]